MTGKDARKKIADILEKQFEVDRTFAEYVAEKIFVDVVAVAIDDELNRWLFFVYSDMEKLHS